MDITSEEDNLYRISEEVDYDALDQIVDEVDEEVEVDDGSSSTLLRLIQTYNWAGVLARIASHSSECFEIGEHLRTPLHFACSLDAPAVVIQSLLKTYPEASLLTGSTNMNPLHITCSSQHASAHVVRVLLECGRFEQFSMRDIDGDTPLHAACRCGAPIDVIEVLLRAHFAVVHERDYEGLTPVQRLWVRYFVILGDAEIDSVNSSTDLIGELLDAWTKTELLLRCAHHGHLGNTRPGGLIQFRAVHAAAAVDCPRAIVKIATKIYPHQIEERDEHGLTPLMIAAAAHVYKVRDLSDQGYTLEDVIYSENPGHEIQTTQHSNNGMGSSDYSEGNLDSGNSSMYPSVIEILLEAHRTCPVRGARLLDPSGRLPLHIALSSGKRWEEGVKQLIEAYPDAVSLSDRSSKLFPFMLAASSSRDLTSTYELLRLNPSLLVIPTRNISTKFQMQRKEPVGFVEENEIEMPEKLLEATRL